MKIILLIALWLTTFGMALSWVKLTHFGPVLLTVSARRGWGVHSGDFWALIPLFIAIIFTFIIIFSD